jgi:cytochrome c-type biogenesis protein CcmH
MTASLAAKDDHSYVDAGLLRLAQNKSQQLYPFESPALQQRFENITTELRCLVCQNESIADSNAPLAKDLRDEVYYKLQHGYSEDEIKNYLVDRYGQFILFRPAFNLSTVVLWIFPLLVLMIGFLILFFQTQRKPRHGNKT